MVKHSADLPSVKSEEKSRKKEKKSKEVKKKLIKKSTVYKLQEFLTVLDRIC